MKNKATSFTLLVLALAVAGMAQGYPNNAELRPFDAATNRGGSGNESVVRYQNNEQIRLVQPTEKKIGVEAEVINQRANTITNNTAETEQQKYVLAGGTQDAEEIKATKLCCNFEENVSEAQKDLTTSTSESWQNKTANVPSLQSEEATNQAPDSEGVADGTGNAGETEVKLCCDSPEKVFDQKEQKGLLTAPPAFEQNNTGNQTSLQSQQAANQSADVEGVTVGAQNTDESNATRLCCDSNEKASNQEPSEVTIDTSDFREDNLENLTSRQSEEAPYQEYDIEGVPSHSRDAEEGNLEKPSSPQLQGVDNEDPDQEGIAVFSRNPENDKIPETQFLVFEEGGQSRYGSGNAINVSDQDAVQEERIG